MASQPKIAPLTHQLAEIQLQGEQDTVTARELAHHLAQLVGLSPQQKTKLATAVAEIARNAVQYAGGGTVVCGVCEQDGCQFVAFVVSDDGPGVARLDDILAGTYRSRSGMGMGIIGTKRLMDLFTIRSGPSQGTVVNLGLELPRACGPITAEHIAQWKEKLGMVPRSNTLEMARRQQAELLQTLEELRQKEKDLQRQLQTVEQLNQELVEAQKTLQEQATMDALTDLPNRRAILMTLEREVERSRRLGSPLAVAMADIDHFKSLNDTYGHSTGDEALRETARRMESVLRAYDSVGRYGGEEFLLVVPGCQSQDARAIADRMRRAVGREPMRLNQDELQVTISVGVASASGSESPANLIDRADTALYHAKANGRNRVEVAKDVEPTD